MSAPVKADKQTLQRNVIAAAGSGFRGARRLPQIADDAINDLHFNAQTYEKISCDPEAFAALMLIVIMVLADDVQLAPAVSEKDDRYKLADEIKEHLDRTFKNLQRPLKDTLEMLIKPAMTFGHKVAEKVYEIPTDGPDAYRLVLKAIKALKRGSTAFVVDEYMNLLGLVPSGGFVGQTISDQTKVIPLEKFVIATFRMKDEDPRGQSFYLPIVKPWHVKQLSWPEFLTYLMRCAIPGLIAVLSEKAEDEPLQDDAGNPITDPTTGNAITISAVNVMLKALLDFKNSTALVVENGTDVKVLEVQGKGEIWPTAFGVVNKEIRKGTLLQELATADAEHQTKGSTSSQMGIVELLVWSIKRWVAETIIRRQICQPQVEYNFGTAAALELTPKVSLGDTDRKDWATDAEAIVALATATITDEEGNMMPLLTYSQIQALCQQLGIPAPSEDEVKAMRERKEQMKAEKQNQEEQQKNQPPGQQPTQPQQEKKAS